MRFRRIERRTSFSFEHFWKALNRPQMPMTVEPVTSSDPVIEAVRTDLLARSAVGIRKYGVTLAAAGLDHRAWLQHAYEEALDMANYLKGAILELDAATAPVRAPRLGGVAWSSPEGADAS